MSEDPKATLMSEVFTWVKETSKTNPKLIWGLIAAGIIVYGINQIESISRASKTFKEIKDGPKVEEPAVKKCPPKIIDEDADTRTYRVEC